MQIKLNLQLFLFIIIFYFTKQIELYVTLMIFAVIHELAHMLLGMLLGLKPRTFEIMPLGFCLQFETYQKKSYPVMCKQKIAIALAGPCINFFIALMAIIVPFSFWGLTSETIIYANILIGVFNLLPIYPLDGGRIVKYWLEKRGKRVKAITISNQLSYLSTIILTFAGSIAIYYYQNLAILLILAYLWILVWKEGKKNRMRISAYQILEK